jgi:hypothetical protein
MIAPGVAMALGDPVSGQFVGEHGFMLASWVSSVWL